MGSWNETCALTRLSLDAGHATVALLWRPEAAGAGATLYSLKDAAWRHCLRRSAVTPQPRGAHDACPGPQEPETEHSDLLRLASALLDDRSSPEGPPAHHRVIRALYDGEGGLRRLEGGGGDLSFEDLSCFPYMLVHRQAYDDAVAQMRALGFTVGRGSAWHPPSPEAEDVYLFLCFCWDAHVPLVPHQEFRGRQRQDRESLAAAHALRAVTARLWRAQYRQYVLEDT